MCYQMKSETEQLNLRPQKKTIEKLQKLADKFFKRSKAEVAVEIIEEYMDLWERAESAKRQVIDGQHRAAALIKEKPKVNQNEKPDIQKVKKTGS
jgi:hypothetical protein